MCRHRAAQPFLHSADLRRALLPQLLPRLRPRAPAPSAPRPPQDDADPRRAALPPPPAPLVLSGHAASLNPY